MDTLNLHPSFFLLIHSPLTMELILLNPTKAQVQAKIDEFKDSLACVTDPSEIFMHEHAKISIGCKTIDRFFQYESKIDYPLCVRAFAARNNLDLKLCNAINHAAKSDSKPYETAPKECIIFSFWELHTPTDEQLADHIRPKVKKLLKHCFNTKGITAITSDLKKRKLPATGNYAKRCKTLLDSTLEEHVAKQVAKMNGKKICTPDLSKY